MYRRILMPIDGSACSDAALAHGLRLAKEQGAEVKILHVLDTQALYLLYEGMYVEEIADRWRREGEAFVTRAADRARAAGVGVTTELADEGGRIPDVIVGKAKTWPADLIVMGTHGRHGFDHLLLGSAAEGVVRTTPVPVLLIRKE
ncbi:MAG TPA: universal stress protein [bacterium]|nr:universal stress protein [bacterium]